MSRHYEGFQMYNTRTSEEARRRNRYATNQMNNELGTQKELERLHLETMKKERRRLETELSKIRNKGQYMVKRPTNVSNQAVNFTLRQAGPLYGSKSNPGVGSAWHPPTGNKNNGVKRRTSRKREAEKESPQGRHTTDTIDSQKQQVGNDTAPQQPQDVNKTEPNVPTVVSADIKAKPLKEEVTVENGIRRKSVTTVTKSGAIVEVISSQGAMAATPTPSPRRNNKKTKDTISNLNIDEARESVAKRLLSHDQDKAAPRSSRKSPSLTTVPEEAKPVAVPSLSKAPLSDQGSKSGSASSTTGGSDKPAETASATRDPDRATKREVRVKSPPAAQIEEAEEDSANASQVAENRARDLKRVKQMLENPTQVFDQGKYAPDGGLRTMHLMPDSDEMFVEARKARYLRGKDWTGQHSELSINEIFGKEKIDTNKEREGSGISN